MPEEVENAEEVMDTLKYEVINECPSAAIWLWEFWNELKKQAKGC